MCGRYSLGNEEKSAEMKKIVETLTKKVGTEKISKVKCSGEIFPCDLVPALMQTKVEAMKWGFVQNDGKILINARSESASIRQMFKMSFNHMRCLIPAVGYYEWWKYDGRNHKCLFTGEQQTIYMAGLYRFDHGEKYPRFVVLTRNAAPGISYIHDRMPVILSGDARREWLLGSDPQSTLQKAQLNITARAV